MTAPFASSTDEGRSRERYRRVGLTFLATVAGRGAAAVVALVSVPVMLRYLGAERYGLWAALSSAWAALLFADLGIGNGLLSVLAEDAGRDDHEAAQTHVSSAFVALVVVALALGAAFALVHPAVPWAAARVGIPMHVVEPEPWDVSVRLRSEPRGVRRYVVAPGSRADGAAIRDLPLGEHTWVSLIVRDGEARQARGAHVFAAGDEVLLLSEAHDVSALRRLFEGRAG